MDDQEPPKQPPTVQQAVAEALQEAAWNRTALDNIAVLVLDVRTCVRTPSPRVHISAPPEHVHVSGLHLTQKILQVLLPGMPSPIFPYSERCYDRSA